jgi:hypothetical protein
MPSLPVAFMVNSQEQRMKRIFVVALGLLFISDVVSSAASAAPDESFDRSYKPPAARLYKADAATLYQAGFSVRAYNLSGAVLPGGTAAVGPDYPNKCFLEDASRIEISLSDEFYNHYRARGFSLAALCLAVSSGRWVKYDIQTGRPLRIVNDLMLDVPDCFRNGAPFLDCAYNFEHTFGLKVRDAERQKVRQRAIEVDQSIRVLFSDGKFSQQCTCNDLEITRDETTVAERKERVGLLQIKGSGYRGQPPALQYACRVEHVPPCAQNALAGRNLAGWMVYEVQDGYLFKWTALQGGTDYGSFEISPSLPHGYAYRIGSPEGDDDSPFLDVPPGTKLNVRE